MAAGKCVAEYRIKVSKKGLEETKKEIVAGWPAHAHGPCGVRVAVAGEFAAIGARIEHQKRRLADA